ncbi:MULTISPECIES: asparagine synthase (glutamine-hydrolyzing) [Thermodesulfovibrio]|uniref:asparagine synthase (glutamine-hydrolyzing) n=1 Tax=Thermodesulfovibrio TaxID=28261 RepID=UPI002627EFC8|nr:asparagine synthase (glutamine-hydrolyzing) [Thermodesulfovibrio sp.]
MCGIAGCVALNHKTVHFPSTKKMVDVISHRGPDDAGYLYFHTGCRHIKGHSFHMNLSDKRYSKLAPLIPDIQDEPVIRELNRHDWDIFLGHRRLAILDLTEAGHQPMSDLSQNIWIVYNGEIYNFQELRAELEKLGHKFKSHTDTEVIIYAYIEWGIYCIEKFNGMFAFALYDNFQKKFYLVRDKYGIKPLYYSLIKEPAGWTLLFASEIKALMQYDYFQKDMDFNGVVEYFSFQNFFTDRTFWRDAKILLPGHYIEISLGKKEIGKTYFHSRHKSLITAISDFSAIISQSNLEAKIQQYWDFEPFQVKFKGKEADLIKNLEEVFERAVNRQLLSDVEVGSYLSGGMDSGSISAIASKHFRQKKGSFKTFTIGFDLHSASGLEITFDEREKAEHMAYLFETEHYEMVLKAGDMQRCIYDLVYHLEDTRVGQSYPNYYAAKLASKFVKVVLSGCGGDELFGGYPWRYYHVLNAKTFDEFVEKYFKFWIRLLPFGVIHNVFSPIKGQFTVNPREIFVSVIPENFRKNNYSSDENIELAMYFEQKTFLHGLLIVEDKLSMKHSLESRVPFLDNELVDFAQKIPVNLKITNIENFANLDENDLRNIKKTNDGKVILRKMMKKYVPEEISNSVKQGFSAPDSSWFRGESIDFVRKVLLNPKARIYEFLDRKIIQDLIDDHFSGRKNRRLLIWSLLSFKALIEVHS